MVYNFNLGIGWASSGVEYAQSYRANLLRRAHIPARFVFTDMFPTENIEHAGISLRRAAGSTPATWSMIQVI